MPSDVEALFATTFGRPPTGVWSAPGRVNLIGEYTDLADGHVMPFAIGMRARVAASTRSDERVRLVAADREPAEVAMGDIGPGTPPGWAGYLAGAAWALRQHGAAVSGCDIALISDVPIGAGLSSSAAITSAALLALDELNGLRLDRPTLARLGRLAENTVVGVPCGAMDHSAALRCVAANAMHLDTATGEVEQVPLDLAGHGLAILVIDTRAQHRLLDGGYAQRRAWIEQAQQVLGHGLRETALPDIDAAAMSAEAARAARHVITENARVLEVRDLLLAKAPEQIGPALVASHASLRDDLRVSCHELDLAVDSACAAGALGARMTGGGFGGSALALVEADAQDDVARAVDRAFRDHRLEPPRVFAVAPLDGARREA